MKKRIGLIFIFCLFVFSGIWVVAQLELDLGSINLRVASQNSPLVESLFADSISQPRISDFGTLELSPIYFHNTPTEVLTDEGNV